MHSTNTGLSSLSTTQEEGVLAAHLFYMAEDSFPLTANTARGFAWALLLYSAMKKQDQGSIGGAIFVQVILN